MLHRILDLFTSGERWRDATNVLARLAEAQKNTAIRAKYLYAGALILRDHIGDERDHGGLAATHARGRSEQREGPGRYLEALQKIGRQQGAGARAASAA